MIVIVIVVVIVIVIVAVIVIICNEYMYISSCLPLPYLILSCIEWTSITIAIIGMTLYDLVLHYHIISYLMFFYFISSADLISILFYSLLLNLIYHIVQYSISYQWMICVYLSVCPSVCIVISGLDCLSFCLYE